MFSVSVGGGPGGRGPDNPSPGSPLSPDNLIAPLPLCTGSALLGAESVTSVELDSDAIEDLQDNISEFEIENIDIIQGDVQSALLRFEIIIIFSSGQADDNNLLIFVCALCVY